jgi:hypothetical protein
MRLLLLLILVFTILSPHVYGKDFQDELSTPPVGQKPRRARRVMEKTLSATLSPPQAPSPSTIITATKRVIVVVTTTPTARSTPAPPLPPAPPAAKRIPKVLDEDKEKSAFQAGTAGAAKSHSSSSSSGSSSLFPKGIAFVFTNAQARLAALEAYDSLVFSEGVDALSGEHLRAWAETALSVAALDGGRIGAAEAAALDPPFARFAARQGFAGAPARPLPRALVVNGASLSFLVDAAPRVRAARTAAADEVARAAIADLNREHPRRGGGGGRDSSSQAEL